MRSVLETGTPERAGWIALVPVKQGMDEDPGKADGNEYGEEDEGEHKAPGGSRMFGAVRFKLGASLGMAIICGIDHRN